jgi:NAD(P)H dehydrogenase (quinone)
MMNMAAKLLVTGASGNLGKLTLDALLERGVAPGDIIATTRDAAKLADYAAKGITVRVADFNDSASLVTAFAGAERLALISTNSIGTRVDQQKAAVQAAKAAGVKHIVYTSMPNPTPKSHITFEAEHRLTEEEIKASGLDYTILRNSWYQENLFMNLPQALKTGQWFTSAGEGKVSHIARAECADALAAVLIAPPAPKSTYTLTGAASYTNAEIAAMTSEVTGKPIAVINLTDEELAGGMKSAGVPEAMIPFILGFEKNTRVGDADLVNDDLEKLTGKKPRSLRAFLDANKDALQA